MGGESDILERRSFLTAQISLGFGASDQGRNPKTVASLFFLIMIIRKQRFYLERSLRNFVRAGVLQYIPSIKDQFTKRHVIMAKDDLASPPGLFATLQYVGETRSDGHSFERESGGVFMQQAIHARYLVSFFRTLRVRDEGRHETWTSYDAAQAFVDFVESHCGAAWSSNAITDGQLHKVYVYQTNGSRIADARFAPSTYLPVIEVPHGRNERGNVRPGENATIKLYASSNGKVESGFVVNPGSGFFDGEEVSLSAFESKSHVLPTVVCTGRGFTIDKPLMIEEDDYPLSENKIEKRALIEMDISFVEERRDGGSKRYGGDPIQSAPIIRYETGINWNQGIDIVPDSLRLPQTNGGEVHREAIGVKLRRIPAAKVKLILRSLSPNISVYAGPDGATLPETDEGDPYIEITPKNWNEYQLVWIGTTANANSLVGPHQVEIEAQSDGREEDNVKLSPNYSVVIENGI